VVSGFFVMFNHGDTKDTEYLQETENMTLPLFASGLLPPASRVKVGFNVRNADVE
jgi:hypothetical protein